MTEKGEQVALESVSEVPETAAVCHFDELMGPLQEKIVTAEKRGQRTLAVTPAQAAQIDDCPCDIIKYTEYYRITRY